MIPTRRLAFILAGLTAIILALFLGAAFAEVERTLIAAAGDRHQSVATQIAGLFTQSTQQRFLDVQRVAANPAIARFVQQPTPDHQTEAERVLSTLGRAESQLIELWNAADERVLTLPTPGADGRVPKPTASRPPDGLQPLRLIDGIVSTVGVVPIPTGGAIGIRRAAQVSPPGLLAQLVGRAGRVMVGNVGDGVWTDFTNVVPPPLTAMTPGVSTIGAGSDRRIGALALIAGTPWAVWVDAPRADAVAPAFSFVRRMALLGVLFVAIAAVSLEAAFVAIQRTGRRAERQFDRFFSLSLDMLAIVTPDGRFLRINPAWHQVLGWTVEDLRAKPYIDFVHPDDHEQTVAEAAAVGRGRDAVGFENRYRDKDGNYHWLSWKATVGEDKLLYCTARDITDTKLLHETITVARQEAERANRAKTAFLSRMSHDLRTPLNAILGFAQLLEKVSLDAEHHEHVRQILSGGQHLLDLINEVLDISRIESGQLSVSLEPVPVADTVERALALIRPLAAPRNISIDAPVVHDTTVAVLADRQRLNQVVLNLLSNAVKYNRANGCVTVTLDRIGPDRVRINVADTGAGIPDAKRALLFQPFERLGAESSTIEGTGLGLALSRALAQAMGGTLGVDSVVDRGSTFWVELRRAELPEARALSRDVRSDAVDPQQKAVVLYIEDNLSNVRLMRGVLRERPSIELVHAPSGEAGLSDIRTRRPNLVLLDLHLPDMDGEEVLRRMFDDRDMRTIPVAVLTADASPGVTRRVRAAGATACLSKPLDINAVIKLIDDLVGVPPPQGADHV